jgi:hypothetical protein
MKVILDIFLNYKINIDSYHILFFTLCYIFVHFINYSTFHVNNVHEYHHKDTQKNFGPDFLDILLNTKHDPEHNLEDTTHYIYAIVLSLGITFMVKWIESISNKNAFINTTVIGYILLYTSIKIATMQLWLYDIHDALEKNLSLFI